MKDYLKFILGVIAGCVGLLCAQQVMKPDSPTEVAPAGDNGQNSLAANRDGQLLADARGRIAELEEELAAVREEPAADPGGGGEVPDFAARAETDGKAEEAKSFIETLMSFGDKETERKIDREVERLAGLLGLSENQQQIVRQAFAQKAADQKAAGIKVMTGQASIGDLIKSDEDNFTAVDAAIMEVLDDEQLAAYTQVQENREVERVQKKAEKELEELAGVGALSEDQSDAAWELFVEINAGEKPGEVPEGISNGEFMGIVDDSINNRVEGLRPILNEEQFETYQGQVGDFRNIISTLIGHATGSGAE